MTQEEKQLLLKDLCARLPYGVICKRYENAYELVDIDIKRGLVYLLRDEQYVPYSIIYGDEIKPYLRSMSSMTEEEIEEYRNLSDEVIGSYGPYHREFIAHCVRLGIKPDNPHECVDGFLNMEAIDWLNAHHFDYRGLIDKGLAIEVTEEINPYE